MFQKNLYSYFPLFQTLFSISTFVVQISGQGNGLFANFRFLMRVTYL